VIHGVIDQIRYRTAQLLFTAEDFERAINLKRQMMLFMAQRLRLHSSPAFSSKQEFSFLSH